MAHESGSRCHESPIFLDFAHKFTHKYTERDFQADFGGPSYAVEKLFQWILFHLKEDKENKFDADDLLMCLYFLKTGGPNWEVISSRFGVDNRTFKTHLNHTLDLIDAVLPEVVLFFLISLFFSHFCFQFDFEERKCDWPYSVPSCILDCFKVPIEQQELEPWKYLIGTSKWGVKYEIGLSLGIRHVCWLSGPFCGAASDTTIPSSSGFKNSLPSTESVMADKIYKGNRKEFLCPLTGTRFSLDEDGKE
jgi:DDE superfamily endonuclease